MLALVGLRHRARKHQQCLRRLRPARRLVQQLAVAAPQRAERKYGVPVPVLMATLRKESGFKSNAKPPRTKLLGFIPWKRPSTAYGYSQALDGTWAQYQRETGNCGARRTYFADAVDFVGWYHSKSADTLGIARNDTYNLYLAYYLGWGGYKRGDWQSNAASANMPARPTRWRATMPRRCASAAA